MACSHATLSTSRPIAYENLESVSALVAPSSAQQELVVDYVKKNFPCYPHHLNERTNGTTLLHDAITHRNVPIIKALLSLGASKENIDDLEISAERLAPVYGLSLEIFKNHDLAEKKSGNIPLLAQSNPIAPLAQPVGQDSQLIEFLSFFDRCIQEDGFEKLEKTERRSKKYVDPDTKQTLLHRAAIKGASQRFTLFLIKEWCLSPIEKDSQGKTPIHYAAIHANDGAWKAFRRDCGQLLDSDGRNPYHYAAIHGSLKILCEDLIYYPRPDTQRLTLLHLAAMSGQTAAVDCLLSSKMVKDYFNFDFNSANNKLALSPIELAAREGHLGVFIKLYPHTNEKALENAASLARENNHEAIVNIIENKSLPAPVAFTFDQVLEESLRGDKELIEYLHAQIAVGADVNLRDNGKTLLQHAVEAKNIAIASALVNSCYAFLDISFEGYIPLHHAILSGWIEGVELLGVAMRRVDELTGQRKDEFDRGHNLFSLASKLDFDTKNSLHAFFLNTIDYKKGTSSSYRHGFA